MERDCLDKIWDVAYYIGQMTGTLIAEGTRQKTVMHENWMAPPIALPTNGDVIDDFDAASRLLMISIQEIKDYCVEGKDSTEKQRNAIGEARLFENPFQRPVGQRGRHSYAPTAQQLWFELNMVGDFVMDWVDEINMSEPYRHAVSV